MEKITEFIFTEGARLGWTILKACLIYLIGRFLIQTLNKILKQVLGKRDLDLSVKTFVLSTINVVLTVLLIISVIGTLGFQTTSFAALLASAGVAIGMALSGNLSNFAGGLIILLFKPFRVGDYIEYQSIGGTVREIQIFHTLLTTSDNKSIYVPNSSLSSGIITNYSKQSTRRVEWIISIEYGEDIEKVKKVITGILAGETRILPSPVPFIALKNLGESQVEIVVRVWVESSDYWSVYFDINQQIYRTFNEQKINFPFPQLTIHTNK
ncbi:MAG: mechanosensitive ion channel [Tannerellaceae bacterium]|nr:mechanosensitive ion channel [Tannerellaceae bacterium]